MLYVTSELGHKFAGEPLLGFAVAAPSQQLDCIDMFKVESMLFYQISHLQCCWAHLPSLSRFCSVWMGGESVVKHRLGINSIDLPVGFRVCTKRKQLTSKCSTKSLLFRTETKEKESKKEIHAHTLFFTSLMWGSSNSGHYMSPLCDKIFLW